MRKVESLTITYVGYQSPANSEEIEFEILGLQTAIASAQQRIAVLRQSVKFEQLLGENKNAEIVQKTSDIKTAEQES